METAESAPKQLDLSTFSTRSIHLFLAPAHLSEAERRDVRYLSDIVPPIEHIEKWIAFCEKLFGGDGNIVYKLSIFEQ